MYYVESKYFCLSGFNVKYLSISGSLSLLSSCFSFIVVRLPYESHYPGKFIASDEDGIIAFTCNRESTIKVQFRQRQT